MNFITVMLISILYENMQSCNVIVPGYYHNWVFQLILTVEQ